MGKFYVGKAIAAFIVLLVFMVIVPWVLYTNYLQDNPYFPVPITEIMTFGTITAVAGLFRTLFENGTREHGVASLIFTAWFVWNGYFLLSLGGQFGTIPIEIPSAGLLLSVDITILAIIIIGIGVATIVLYVYEAIV